MKTTFENSRWKIEQTFQLPEQQYLQDLFDLLLNLEQKQIPNLNPFINEIVIFLKSQHDNLMVEYNLIQHFCYKTSK